MARQKAQYNTRQVLELAIEVDKAQGLLKAVMVILIMKLINVLMITKLQF